LPKEGGEFIQTNRDGWETSTTRSEKKLEKVLKYINKEESPEPILNLRRKGKKERPHTPSSKREIIKGDLVRGGEKKRP